ncbi:MAG: hypothetical protein DIU61_016020 [Bacteroidota bacterium]|jgi:hypothetical protein|nr:MAG: hypothetical protein DIU61_16300 [Bacteroidota bacterium]HLT73414.1 hypothetical protein [Cyclobacteriaceae bacterium]
METTSKIEDFLMSNLSDNRMDKAMLKKLSSAVDKLRKHDVVVERIWRYGQPAIDGIVVSSRVRVKDFGRLSNIFDIPELWKAEVFPIGLPYPEILQVNMRIGEQIEPPRHGFL